MTFESTQPATPLTHLADIGAIVHELRRTAYYSRVASFKTLSPTAHTTDADVSDRFHLNHFAVGFRALRKTGKSHWATQQLSPRVMVVTSNVTYRETILDRATKPHPQTGAPPLTAYNREALNPHVVTWRDCLADLESAQRKGGWLRKTPDPTEDLREVIHAMGTLGSAFVVEPPDHPLQRVDLLIIDEFQHMQIPLEKIARWSRLGGKVPEIVIIN